MKKLLLISLVSVQLCGAVKIQDVRRLIRDAKNMIHRDRDNFKAQMDNEFTKRADRFEKDVKFERLSRWELEDLEDAFEKTRAFIVLCEDEKGEQKAEMRDLRASIDEASLPNQLRMRDQMQNRDKVLRLIERLQSIVIVYQQNIRRQIALRHRMAQNISNRWTHPVIRWLNKWSL